MKEMLYDFINILMRTSNHSFLLFYIPCPGRFRMSDKHDEAVWARCIAGIATLRVISKNR